MKFFNIDCHISVIADIKNIFKNLNHQVDQWSISGHRHIFNLPESKSKIINEQNWTDLDEAIVDDFYKTHKNELDQYDAFICCYPPCFLKLYEKFNKPIIVVAATRYEHPFTNNIQKLEWLNNSLNNNNNLILIANNQFDKKYCEKFTTKKWKWIPSLCAYTKAKHTSTINKTIVFSKFNLDKNEQLIHQYELGQYKWQDLYSYKNIIHFPYNASTMSIFEQYEAGVPLLFPSLRFSLELIRNKIPIFSEIIFDNNDPNKQRHLFLNEEWLKLSDFYNGTIKCHYFDSFDDARKMTNKILPNTNISNKDFIYNRWAEIFNNEFNKK